eukprot:scaffold361818_cov25-Prasinocladus_malaysianus.AAC.1
MTVCRATKEARISGPRYVRIARLQPLHLPCHRLTARICLSWIWKVSSLQAKGNASGMGAGNVMRHCLLVLSFRYGLRTPQSLFSDPALGQAKR